MPSPWGIFGFRDAAFKVKVNVADAVGDFLANKLVAGSGISFNILNPGGNEQIEISSTGGTSGLDTVLDEFSSTAGQTSFTLSSVPLLPGTVQLWVNGVAYVNGTDFAVALNTVTWLNTDFSLLNGQTVLALYNKNGGSSLAPVIDTFTALAAQTNFTLTQLPLFTSAVMMFVNGLAYANGTDFGVVGTAATWNNVDFTLPAGAIVTFVYDKVGGSVLTERQDVFTASAAQTSFTLSHLPTSNGTVEMFVNGILYKNGTDFTVVGTAVTWNNVVFTFGGGETVLFVYDF